MKQDAVRLHSLDALRGLAALAVVFWHWQHFQLLGTSKLTWPPLGDAGYLAREPFHQALRVFYEQGLLAVDLFFIVSGFIFFWLYQVKLAERKLSIADFFVLRLSRLYPLHFSMVIIIAILQYAFIKITGQFFVYSDNNLKTFLESIFFIQDRSAFNGPEWSLTIELLMYIIFCALARCRMLGSPIVPVAMVLVGFALHFVGNALHNGVVEDVSRGFCGFFFGGLTFILFNRVRNTQYARMFTLFLMLIAAAGSLAVVVDIYSNGMVQTILVGPASNSRLHYILQLSVLYALFPITVLSIALHEALYSERYQAVAWLGEISYSSYLIHFPLQLVLALSVVSGMLTPEAIRSPIGLIIYITILISLSLLVFRKFEIPIQNALREKWANRRFASRKELRARP